jgi:hypothetical protein
MKIIPFNPVVSLHHVNFEGEERWFGFLLMDGVQTLESNQGIIRDQAVGNKGALLL